MPNHDRGLSMHLIRVLEPHPRGLRIEQCREALPHTPSSRAVEAALIRLRERKIAQRLAPRHYALTPAFRSAFAGHEETQV
jgi:hypothetical protein